MAVRFRKFEKNNKRVKKGIYDHQTAKYSLRFCFKHFHYSHFLSWLSDKREGENKNKAVEKDEQAKQRKKHQLRLRFVTSSFSSQMVAGELLTWRRLKGEKDILKKNHVTTVVKGKSQCSNAHCIVVEAKGIHKRRVCYTGKSETKQAARQEISSCWSPSN